MKETMKRIYQVMVYFFTPEDSSSSDKSGFVSFKLDMAGLINLGTAKLLFWIMTLMTMFHLLALI